MTEIAITAAKGLIMILILMGAAAYMTFFERIIMARMQQRLGPNRTGPLGLLQPIADGIKLLLKESFVPANAETFTYWLAPAISLFTALFAFVLIPVGGTVNLFGHPVRLQIADVNAGFLFLLAFSSLAVYGIVLAGWSSNNRYSLLGSLRGTAQMISYEIPMGLSLVSVALMAGTLTLSEIVEAQRSSHWFIWTNPIGFMIYLITAFAETNRAPFDLAEAESELTAGFHTEYSGMKFALFFLAEYVNIFIACAIGATLFFGGWMPFHIGHWETFNHIMDFIPSSLWFMGKTFGLIFLLMWFRWTFPRLRVDQLLNLEWKYLLPISMINLLLMTLIAIMGWHF